MTDKRTIRSEAKSEPDKSPRPAGADEKAALLAEIEDLRAQLQSARETARALIAREVDSVAQGAGDTPALLREAQAALREGQAQLRAIFEGALDGLVLMDGEGSFLEGNPAALEILGVSADELAGKTAADFVEVSPEDFEAGWSAFLEERHFEAEHVVVRPAGGQRRVEIRARANVSPGRHLAVLRDVTERRRLEETLRQSHRLESIGRLAGGLAHDLNNTLMVITGFTSLAQQGRPPSDPTQGHLEEVLRAANEGAELLKQLLAFGRRETLSPKPTTLGQLVASATRMTGRLLREDVELVVGHGADDVVVHVDPARVEHVLMDVLLNARDAMDGGGTITVDTAVESVGTDRKPGWETLAPGRYAVISVHDSGPGMAPETRRRIFEPFFTTKEAGKGTGLGLATVYGIIKQSLGHIECETEVGQGTTFRIYLPVEEEPAHGSAPSETATAGIDEVETVLVVEDEDAIRRFVVQMLRREGYRVLEAARPGDALLASEQEPGPIQLLLSDVVMPRMSGPELAKRIVAERPDTQVLFMSGYAADDLKETSDVKLLSKPFGPEELSAAVRRALDAGPKRLARP